MLANASNAIIVGFNVRPDPVAAQNAERDGVDIRCYRIIYDCIDEIQAAIKGMLAPKFREVQQGRAEVRQIVKISSVGNIAAAMSSAARSQETRRFAWCATASSSPRTRFLPAPFQGRCQGGRAEL